ncbi:hypothetical protein DXU93_01540 [Brumimicrobium aurantiacum]|uniref:Uncharacterized protein n=2 Tax=Brumimicrobium aurantiacum TaxID=1737063 RepID=A0A3E1F1D9_9FLAO|nr:hypothetical protein DXU93_01540 [Brumimicrobium aurantiacum]
MILTIFILSRISLIMNRKYTGKYHDVDQNDIPFSVQFSMNVVFDSKMIFKGKVWEEVFSKKTDKFLSVKGFIDEDHISFIKQYPCFFSSDINGELIIDCSKPGHEVIYDGYWNEEKGIWEGEWEVEGETNLLGTDDVISDIYTGDFEMKMD